MKEKQRVIQSDNFPTLLYVYQNDKQKLPQVILCFYLQSKYFCIIYCYIYLLLTAKISVVYKENTIWYYFDVNFSMCCCAGWNHFIFCVVGFILNKQNKPTRDCYSCVNLNWLYYVIYLMVIYVVCNGLKTPLQ